MIKFKQFIKNLLLLIALTLTQQAIACEQFFIPKEAAYLFEQGIVGKVRGYVPSLLKERHGESIAQPGQGFAAWLYHLEGDVLDILNIAPEFRARHFKALAAKYQIAEDKAEYIVIYYARLFHDDIRIAGDPEEVFPKLRALNRNHTLGDGDPALTQRYLFYLLHVTNLSVPQMADVLDIGEAQVYAELMHFGISIADEFSRAEQAGQPLGAEALTYYRHYQNTENRGVSWDRLLWYKGKDLPEALILEQLYLDEASPAVSR